MWIVLALCLAALVSSLALLRDPEAQRLGVVRAFTWACALAIVGGTGANLIAVFHYMAHHEGADELALYQGLAESLSPLVLGATMLSVAWTVVAVAVRRTGAAA